MFVKVIASQRLGCLFETQCSCTIVSNNQHYCKYNNTVNRSLILLCVLALHNTGLNVCLQWSTWSFCVSAWTPIPAEVHTISVLRARSSGELFEVMIQDVIIVLHSCQMCIVLKLLITYPVTHMKITPDVMFLYKTKSAVCVKELPAVTEMRFNETFNTRVVKICLQYRNVTKDLGMCYLTHHSYFQLITFYRFYPVIILTRVFYWCTLSAGNKQRMIVT